MQIYKLIQGRIRRKLQGVDIAGGVNAVISANVNEPGAYTRVSSRQHLAERAGPDDADGPKEEKEA
jgi:hypothetical protein